jgi:hypothetical protein
MPFPPRLKDILDRHIKQLEQGKIDDLSSGRVLLIYDAIGPTAQPIGDSRIELLHQNIVCRTRADRVRAQLSILTAKKVAFVWTDAMITSKETSTEENSNSEAETYDFAKPASTIGAWDVPNELMAEHTIRLAVEALNTQENLEHIFLESSEIHYFGMGSPSFVISAGLQAAKEALNTVLGLSTFEGLGTLEGKRAVENGRPAWHAAAALEARIAFAGIPDTHWHYYGLDPVRSREFWLWWLTEALPQAWFMEEDFEEPTDLLTDAFWKTAC